jgi:hypothetical protein
MSKLKKIKGNIPLNQGKLIKGPQKIEMPDLDYPVFCFKHLHKDHNLDKCEESEKKSLIEKIVKLSQLSWADIQNAPRHGLGSEKISIDSIKPSCPSFLTDDVKFLLSLRFDGKKPMLGHRNRFIFHVLFIDRDFTVYDH